MRQNAVLTGRIVFALAAAGVTGILVSAEPVGDTSSPRSPVHRGERAPAPPRAGAAQGMSGIARYPDDFRSVDGTLNNEHYKTWGAVGIELLRGAPVDYGDGAHTPAGSHRASARVISNIVSAQDASRPNPYRYSDYMWQWGQFLDHDIDETPVTSPGEAFDIPVPMGDEWFDPEERGDVMIPLDRSAYHEVDGVRQQLNNITAYIDASNVYGSDEPRANELRTLDGTGRLKTSEGDLLPFNVNGFDNAPTSQDPTYFLAGDVRANEQVGLTAMHTLFVREHNHWAGELRAADPDLTGDEIYRRARAIVGAEMQAITYREFLPKLLGPDALAPFNTYDPGMNAGIANDFATAAYRVGHTMLPRRIMRFNGAMEEIEAGHIALSDAFFNPQETIDHGIDPVLRGLAKQTAEDVDVAIIDDVRNFLFGPPGAGGFDLAALNVQRGRDHGLPSYNVARVSVGRKAALDFAEITPDPDVQARLAEAYDSVDDVDAWVGMLAEPHRAGAFVGETIFRILRDQFRRLRDGDRFWYESYLPADMIDLVEAQTLATIIRRNTTVAVELQADVFLVSEPCAADVDGDGAVDIRDLLAIIAAWGVCDACPEDLSGDGVVDFNEVILVLAGWGSCTDS